MEAFSPSSLTQTHYAATLLATLLDNPESGFSTRIKVIHESISSIIPSLTNLLVLVDESISMSEDIVIQTIYVSIGPFFVGETMPEDWKGAKKKKVSSNIPDASVESIFPSSTPLKGLRLNSLSLLRTVSQSWLAQISYSFRKIFSQYPDQRTWIVEEILTSLTKLPDIKHKGSQFR
jgi:cohesin loading factor subunit SCC2